MSPTTALAEKFEEQATRQLTDAIPTTEEIEYKMVLAFNSKDEANQFATDNSLKYPTEFIQKSLEQDGFNIEERDTKNLTSYYYDTVDRVLNKMGISLRMRHKETTRSDCQSSDFEPSRPDLSFKIPTQEGSTTKRLEYQAETSLQSKAGGFGFRMSFAPLIERYVGEFLEEKGPQKAAQWAKTVYETFNGFDWGQYREHFSINCKRTMPYITLYSVEKSNGDLVRDNDGQVAIQTQKPDILPDGATAREVVYQFCLDTNRYFVNDPKNSNQTIHLYDDHEIEYELQVQGDEYMNDAKSSTAGITYEEAYAAKAVINKAINRALKSYGVEKCVQRSNESKQARGFMAIDEHNKKNQDHQIQPDGGFTVRGRRDLFVMDTLSWQGMVEKAPSLKRALEQIVNFHAPKTRKLG